MATDARISLAGKPTDVASAIATGQQTGERFRTQGVREQILGQTAQVNQQTIEQNQRLKMMQGLTHGADVLKGIKTIPMQDRAAVWMQNKDALIEAGIPVETITSIDLTNDTAIDNQIALLSQMNSVAKATTGTAGMQDFNFYQSIIDDPNSTEQAKQAARIKQGTEASAGRLQIKEVSPGVFQSFDSNNNVMSDPFRQIDGQQVPLSREEQLDLRLGEDVEGITTRGGAETGVEVTRSQLLADVENAKNRGDLISDKQVNRLDGIIEVGLSAANSLPDINRGMELLKTIKTGGATALSKTVTDFFGTTSGDIGELNNLLAQNVLAGLSAFTGAISEGERDFIAKMEANLTGGTEFNIAQLNRMKNIYNREVNKGLKAATILDDQFSIDVFNDAINAEATGFGTNQGQVETQTVVTPTDTTQQTTVTEVNQNTGRVDIGSYINSKLN